MCWCVKYQKKCIKFSCTTGFFFSLLLKCVHEPYFLSVVKANMTSRKIKCHLYWWRFMFWLGFYRKLPSQTWKQASSRNSLCSTVSPTAKQLPCGCRYTLCSSRKQPLLPTAESCSTECISFPTSNSQPSCCCSCRSCCSSSCYGNSHCDCNGYCCPSGSTTNG